MSNGENSTEAVFLSAAGGDRDAFAALVGQHQSMVYSIAHHFTADRATAEEIAQEVFLELYRSLASLQSAAHAEAWLRRVATNRCIDHLRSQQRRPRLALHEIDEIPDRPNIFDPLVSEQLRRMTAALPENARSVMILRYQEDLEPSEISRQLGMPLNTVKSHLQRSLATFRERFFRAPLQRSRVL